MSKVLVDDSSLIGIGSAIRSKNGGSTLYKPSEMAAAINALDMGITPSGTVNISQNGTADVTQYASAVVNVPNTYSTSDEGKVVSNGALVAQTDRTVTSNGTYDTTNNNSVVVNVGSGGSDYPWLDATYGGALTGYVPNVTHAETAGEAFAPASTSIEQAVSNGFSGDLYDLTNGKKASSSSTKTITKAQAELPVADFVKLWEVDVVAKEYAGYIYGTSKITDLGLVLLGDFSQGGSATGNALNDSLANYSGIILQGIYNKNRTSGYNTSVLYQGITTGQEYWAGMKDRNSNYTCKVTFTDNSTVSLNGNKQVIIYGIP